MDERVNVVMLDMPSRIKGFVVRDFDDNGEEYYTIFINSNLCEEVQYKTFRHEIAHIADRDFQRCKFENTDILEAEKACRFA